MHAVVTGIFAARPPHIARCVARYLWVPSTWQAVYSEAAKQGGIVYQGAPYEGLTCDYLELAFAAGGTVLNPGGDKSTINSPQNVKALQLMVDGIKGGSAPKAVTTYMEPETDQAWTSGKYGYMRNWTYAYAADNTSSSKVKGKYKVVGLPTVVLYDSTGAERKRFNDFVGPDVFLAALEGIQ